MDEYRVDKMEVDKVKEGEELTKVSLCKIFFAISILIFCEKLLFSGDCH